MKLQLFKDAYEQSINKVVGNSTTIGAAFPHVAPAGVYNREAPFFWTGGFWGGLLWLAYRETNLPQLRELACEIEALQDAPLNEFIHLHHDVGFMWLPTAVTHYRAEGDQLSRVRGLKAASILAGRFNLAGRFIRAWNSDVRINSQGVAIIDCLMNLPLLYWASRDLDDPRFRQIAMAHADTVLQSFVRPDGTVPHIVRFDPETGEKIANDGGQGKSPDSVWARGQAWAIYGLALSARETGEQRYLDAAKKLAYWFIEHLPESLVPYWDFSTDDCDKHVKDSSAACIAAGGMLEIAQQMTDSTERDYYHSMSLSLLEGLIHNCACFDDSTQGIIKDGTVSYPVNRHVNVPIIYGDFFFVETLAKLLNKPGIF